MEGRQRSRQAAGKSHSSSAPTRQGRSSEGAGAAEEGSGEASGSPASLAPPEAGRSPPCGPCRSPRRAASPGSAPAPSPASPRGSPSPSGNPAHRDRREQTARQLPAGCSGRWAKTGQPSLGVLPREGREGHASDVQPFQDISVVEGWQVQAAAWGPHVLSLRNTPPRTLAAPVILGQLLSGPVPLSRKKTAFAGSSRVAYLNPWARLLGRPSPPAPWTQMQHTHVHRHTRTLHPAHLLLDFLQLQHQLIHLMPGVHKLLCLLLPAGGGRKSGERAHWARAGTTPRAPPTPREAPVGKGKRTGHLEVRRAIGTWGSKTCFSIFKFSVPSLKLPPPGPRWASLGGSVKETTRQGARPTGERLKAAAPEVTGKGASPASGNRERATR